MEAGAQGWTRGGGSEEGERGALREGTRVGFLFGGRGGEFVAHSSLSTLPRCNAMNRSLTCHSFDHSYHSPGARP